MDVALSVARGLYEGSRRHVIEVCGIADPPVPKQERYRCKIHENNMNICSPMRDDEPPDAEFVKKVKAPGLGSGDGAKAAGGGGTGGDNGGGSKERAVAKAGLRGVPCANKDPLCCDWASKGECKKNEVFMKLTCAPACGLCEGGGESCVVGAGGGGAGKGAQKGNTDTPTLSVSPLVEDSLPAQARRVPHSPPPPPFSSARKVTAAREPA